MSTFLTFTIVGIVTGAIYAVAATGLVVTYTTSGIFNFAHGAIGMVMAFVYWQLRVGERWPTPLALVFVLGVLAPVAGAVLERILFRPLHGSSTGVSLVVTLGLLLTLLGGGYAIWDPSTPRVLPRFFGARRLRLTVQAPTIASGSRRRRGRRSSTPPSRRPTGRTWTTSPPTTCWSSPCRCRGNRSAH